MAKTLKPRWVFAIALGSAVGWGAFILPTDWLATGGPLGTLVGFAIGAGLMLVIAVSYGFLIRTFPVSGGELTYALIGYGRVHAFFAGWFLTLGYVCIVALNASALARRPTWTTTHASTACEVGLVARTERTTTWGLRSARGRPLARTDLLNAANTASSSQRLSCWTGRLPPRDSSTAWASRAAHRRGSGNAELLVGRRGSALASTSSSPLAEGRATSRTGARSCGLAGRPLGKACSTSRVGWRVGWSGTARSTPAGRWDEPERSSSSYGGSLCGSGIRRAVATVDGMTSSPSPGPT